MPASIATVISTRPWEPLLVRAARLTGNARVAARCLHAADVERALHRVSAVVVGAEVPWLSPGLITAWRRRGASVIGVTDRGNRRMEGILRRWGCDEVADGSEPMTILASAAGISPSPVRHRGVGVTGPRGAPGRSETAIALAHLMVGLHERPILLVDADPDGDLSLRMGLGPGRGEPEPRRAGSIDLLSPNPGGGPDDLVRPYALTDPEAPHVIDLGPSHAPSARWRVSTTVFCILATPGGILRAAHSLAVWNGPPPHVVVNQVSDGNGDQIARTVRAATGLDPIALIPSGTPAIPGDLPLPEMVRNLRQPLERIVNAPPDSFPGI